MILKENLRWTQREGTFPRAAVASGKGGGYSPNHLKKAQRYVFILVIVINPIESGGTSHEKKFDSSIKASS
jgi:hypothetical protein